MDRLTTYCEPALSKQRFQPSQTQVEVAALERQRSLGLCLLSLTIGLGLGLGPGPGLGPVAEHLLHAALLAAKVSPSM